MAVELDSMLQDLDLGGVEYFSSGSLIVDRIVSGKLSDGGFPRGRIIEIYGYVSCGKTSLALTTVKSLYDKGEASLFLDYENSLDANFVRGHGIDPSNKNLFKYAKPRSCEEGLTLVNKYASQQSVSAVFIDSAASMATMQDLRAVDEKKSGMGGTINKIGESQLATQASVLAVGLRQLLGVLSENKVTLFFLNHVSPIIGSQSHKEESPAGKKIKFYASVRLRLQQRSLLIGESFNPVLGVSQEEAPLGIVTEVVAEKNKITKPYLKGSICIVFGHGVWDFYSAFELGVLHGLITKAGTWYKFPFVSDDLKFQGLPNLYEYFLKHPVESKKVVDYILGELGETSKT